MASTTYDSELKIWSGPKDKEYYGPDMTLGEVSQLIFKLHENDVLQVFDPTGETLTGGQLLEQSRKIAHALQRNNIHRGDVIGISASNTTYLTEVVVAALLCGAPINPLHPDFDQETVAILYEISKPKLIFCDQSNYTILKKVQETLTFKTEVILLSGNVGPGVRTVQQLLLGDGSEGYNESTLFACPQLSGDDTAFIISSSGVTGLPKGVTRSHRSLLNNVKIPQMFPSTKVLFCFSPLYWVSCIFTMLASLVNGCKRIITNRPFSVDYFLELTERHKVTFVFTVPHHMALVAMSNRTDIPEKLSTVDSLVCSGSKVSMALWRKMYDLVGKNKFVVLYGLSEYGGVSKNCGGPIGTEGKLLRNVQVSIRNEDNALLGPNETGQVHLRLNYRWGGYYHNPQDTQTQLTEDAQWLLTGDRGYFDSEGNFHFETRDNDIFKYNNFKIFPKQIEDIILHIPGVHEVGVFGIPHPISTNLTACAVVRTNDAQGTQLTKDEVINAVAKHLNDDYHLHGGVYFVDELPKTINKKIIRRRIFHKLNEKNSFLIK